MRLTPIACKLGRLNPTSRADDLFDFHISPKPLWKAVGETPTAAAETAALLF
jgi:hypothetical protein